MTRASADGVSHDRCPSDLEIATHFRVSPARVVEAVANRFGRREVSVTKLSRRMRTRALPLRRRTGLVLVSTGMQTEMCELH